MNSCLDPWPRVYDFQLISDKSIEPPPEPLPLRYNLDNIWGSGPATGTTRTFASAPAAAPDDATRLSALLRSVPYYASLGKTATFVAAVPLSTTVQSLTTVIPANYDGTFIPSSSVRTVTPPDEAGELAGVTKTDNDTADQIWTPPWATAIKV